MSKIVDWLLDNAEYFSVYMRRRWGISHFRVGIWLVIVGTVLLSWFGEWGTALIQMLILALSGPRDLELARLHEKPSAVATFEIHILRRVTYLMYVPIVVFLFMDFMILWGIGKMGFLITFCISLCGLGWWLTCIPGRKVEHEPPMAGRMVMNNV